MKHCLCAAALVLSCTASHTESKPEPMGAAPAAFKGVPPAPPAKVEEVIETHFGITVRDPYRWMEAQGKDLTDWLHAQNDRTRSVIDQLPGRPQLLERIRALSNSGTRVTVAQRYGGRWFYYKLENGSDDRKLYTRTEGGVETLLVDPTALSKAGPHVSLDWFQPSWDGKYVAYGISPGGSEDSTIHVVESATGKLLPDAIDRSQYAGLSWLPDNSGFFHMRLQKLAKGAPPTEIYRFMKVYLHKLGDDADAAKPLVGNGVPGSAIIGEFDFPAIYASPASPWVLAVSYHGVQIEQTLYSARLDDVIKGTAKWTRVADIPEAVTNADFRGDDVWLLTHSGASRFRIVRTSLAKPDFTSAKEIVPQQQGVLTGLGVAQDGLYLQMLDAGPSRLFRTGFDGGPLQPVRTPFLGSIAFLATNPQLPGAAFNTQGFVDSPRVLIAEGGETRDTGLMAPLAVETSGFEVREEKIASADGTQVPCTVVAKKGLVRDGSHPTLVDGYGSYGISEEPFFSPTLFAWLERGAVYVQAHARGGGEYGEDWHNAGRKATKQHTVDDFVACARLAIEEKLTSPAHLAGSGTSAGGITVGGAITQHPEMFAAALDRVGATNMTRFEGTQGGQANVPEFGTASTEEGFKALYAMDPYLHVKDGVAYPAVLAETGINDPRVASWIPAKFAARLQAANAGPRPILLRVDFDAGHGMGSTRVQADLLRADEYTFLFWQLGDPDFQPGAAGSRTAVR
jgi:prolyl oligopeptidase